MSKNKSGMFNLPATKSDFEAWSDMSEVDTSLVSDVGDLIDEAMEHIFRCPDRVGFDLPFLKTVGSVNLGMSELSVWLGYSGHGKTQLLNYITLDMVKRHHQKALICSYELTPNESIERTVGQLFAYDPWGEAQAREALSTLTSNFYIHNFLGICDPDTVIGVIRYAAMTHGVKFFVIDSLTKIIRDEEDHAGIKLFVDKLCAITRDYQVHIALVCHCRKGDDTKQPRKFDLRGSVTISDQADTVFSVWRNLPNEQGDQDPAQPDVFLSVEKNRRLGTQENFGLWYHPQGGGTYSEHHEERPTSFLSTKKPEAF